MLKRKRIENVENSSKKSKANEKKKYSLDSDEEDEEDERNVLDDNDIEGEEEDPVENTGEERFTAFNMREELEEGHFDKEGHFIWKNEKEVRDNWLDNIDWQKIKSGVKVSEEKGLGEESDDSDLEPFQEIQVYKEIITYLKPKETINKALRRWGGQNEKLSSLERLKRKKAGTLDTNIEVTKLTELADQVLTETGNMDIYQETYESISLKINNYDRKVSKVSDKEAELDMYADDFSTKEKEKKHKSESTADVIDDSESQNENKETMWEYKLDLHGDKIEGPFSTHQMIKWVKEGYFKSGAWVRKHGDESNFYSTNRVDFELYV